MYVQHKNSGTSALLLLLEFQFVNANFWYYFINNIKLAQQTYDGKITPIVFYSCSITKRIYLLLNYHKHQKTEM
jgi:hypothetical protein